MWLVKAHTSQEAPSSISGSSSHAKIKIKKENKMTKDFLEDTKETLGNAYLLYLQNRSEEAFYFGDRKTFDLLNSELFAGLEALLPDIDEGSKAALEDEIEFVKEQMEAQFKDRGSKYLLTDEFLDSLDADNGEDDAAWQQYIGTRLAEASFEKDSANCIFLTGKYRDELLEAYGDEPEMKELFEHFDQYKDNFREVAQTVFEN